MLDDYHVVEAAPVHRLVAYLSTTSRPRRRWCSPAGSSRPCRWPGGGPGASWPSCTPPTWPSPRRRPTPSCGGVMGLDLAPEDVAALTARTEGWPAGLQLAALSVQGRAGAERAGFLRDFSGSQRDVLDFLAQEVLSASRSRCRRSCSPPRFWTTLCGPLCDALTGRTGGQATLEALERANLFVVALDGERRWYRYHGLFADFLRGQLAGRRPGRVPELHRRAAAWYRDARVARGRRGARPGRRRPRAGGGAPGGGGRRAVGPRARSPPCWTGSRRYRRTPCAAAPGSSSSAPPGACGPASRETSSRRCRRPSARPPGWRTPGPAPPAGLRRRRGRLGRQPGGRPGPGGRAGPAGPGPAAPGRPPPAPVRHPRPGGGAREHRRHRRRPAPPSPGRPSWAGPPGTATSPGAPWASTPGC